MKNKIILDYEKRAQSERNAGGHVEINRMLSYVSVVMSNGDEYFFQGEEAGELLKEAENAFNGSMRPKDFILAIAQGW